MYRVRVQWIGLLGSPYLSTFYFDDTGALTRQDAVNAVGTFLGTLDNQLPNAMSWSTEADVDNINDSGVLTGTGTTTVATGNGSISAVLHNTAVQTLIRWSTGAFIGGRELKGRTFIPGVSNTIANSGTGAPTSSWITTVNAAAATLVADATADLRIWSKTNSASATVGSGSCWTQFAVLRSRRD